MYQAFLVIFLIIAISLITLIMLQQNKNNDSGGMFSSRSLGDMLGSGGINDGITCLIVILAILFFLFSLLLGNINSKQNQKYIQNNTQNSQLQD
ncbi:preprotein translocase subunit SecG [Blochmannia endosymbiont of Camponotus modoc]|uniref:preprotein translocase subunit SecG n=1 Tax=Blochmannia endosymbiont of Camponotus modoc TaxID=2945587 RepID=UPI002024CCBA|nr:preprotein translocase subunit SecG [Blochmannia endosymbiont of Camponotus modoc]URJ26099.1 preprotein translocase subunit SecG [Blochmannia endosymbiont of Camponotus modoc]URJ29334.1 preprotein translocase subunit SecG [Blochmannia endosymbiont of Camponotus modoc]URJ31863.1 preprotein translocase subunit SecG [Blochmannia endosymbiont of Camponotus modoc]